MAGKQASIHRIYQGRVLRVWEQKAKAWVEAPNGLELLWGHHELFHAAVNYYLVALAALATDPASPVARMRQQMDTCWNDFQRSGTRRPGMRRSLAPFIGDHADVQAAMSAVLEGNDAPTDVLQAALGQLEANIAGEAAIQQQGREYWPRFCNPASAANFADSPVMRRRAEHQAKLPKLLHDPGTSAMSSELDEFDVYSLGTPDNKEPSLHGEKAKKRLLRAIELWRARRPSDAPTFDRLMKRVSAGMEIPDIPGWVGSSARGEVQARLYALLLFKYVERSEFTLSLLKESTPPPRQADRTRKKAPARTQTGAAVDPVQEARGARGYVFRAFTALRAFSGQDSPDPTWSELDIAAFKEALKTINQVRTKQTERDDKRGKCEKQLAYVRGGQGDATRVFADEEWREADELPGTLHGDPRAERLRRLLEEELARANELTAGERTAYFIGRRTLRGCEELFDAWNKLLDRKAEAGEPELIAICDEHQKRHRDDVGSVELFRALARRDLWGVWRTPTDSEAAERSARGWSSNLLRNYALALELEEEVHDLGRPVNFTPADPVYSRRLFAPGDVKGEFGAKHVEAEGTRAVEFGVAVRCASAWEVRKVRAGYSAPRVLRDGLAGDHARWLVPMLAPIIDKPPEQAGIRDAAVQLMPDKTGGRLRVLLNFPVSIDIDKVRGALGVAGRWGREQFNVLYDEKRNPKEAVNLLWPESDRLRKGKTRASWWQDISPWSVLGVDLGQRTAAACARLRVTAEPDPIQDKGWGLGEAGGHHWNARLERTALLRLPGEEVKLWDGKEWRAEHGGRRGRAADTRDRTDAEEILRALTGHRLEPDVLDGKTFPEQNDKLLVAVRQAQGWLSRLHRWRWMLTEPERRDRALDEVCNHPDSTRISADPAGAPLGELLSGLDREIKSCAQTLPDVLLGVTARVVPLRKLRWDWASYPEQPRCHLLRQIPGTGGRSAVLTRGQRGLSLARIEQIDELRMRWQSLNRTLMREPGQRPPSGREMRNDPVPDPCPDLLRKLDRMKRQRVDQTAHMIVAEALGVQLDEPRSPLDARRREDRHGEYIKRREPVACIVLEDLSRYRSSQDRAPSENSRLMKWCHRAVRDKVKMLCEPLGIQVVEVAAAYSSRFCSRTSVAGFRAVEVTHQDRGEFAWRRALERYATGRAEGKVDEADRVVGETFESLARLASAADSKPPRTLLLPRAGGPIFVPMCDWPPSDRKRERRRGRPLPTHGLQQADINAAINIGLRAIASPSARFVHIRVPLQRSDGAWRTRGGPGASMNDRARWGDGLVIEGLEASGSSAHTTAFWDFGRLARFETVMVDGHPLATGKGLWTAVKEGKWRRVEEINRTRLMSWTNDEPFPY